MKSRYHTMIWDTVMNLAARNTNKRIEKQRSKRWVVKADGGQGKGKKRLPHLVSKANFQLNT